MMYGLDTGRIAELSDVKGAKLSEEVEQLHTSGSTLEETPSSSDELCSTKLTFQFQTGEDEAMCESD